MRARARAAPRLLPRPEVPQQAGPLLADGADPGRVPLARGGGRAPLGVAGRGRRAPHLSARQGAGGEGAAALPVAALHQGADAVVAPADAGRLRLGDPLPFVQSIYLLPAATLTFRPAVAIAMSAVQA